MVESIACVTAPVLLVVLVFSALAYSRTRSLNKRLDSELADLRHRILTLSNRIGSLEARNTDADSTSRADAPVMFDVEKRTGQSRGVGSAAAPTPAVSEPEQVDRRTVQLSSEKPTAPMPAAAIPVPTTRTPAPQKEPAYKRAAAELQENPAVSWFTGTHIVVRAGIVVLFFGVAFLLKYAADQGWLSIELRLAGAAILGLALVAVGWRVQRKESQRVYALTLQGGGLGILYMTTFTAYRIYDLLPAPIAFGILVTVSAATVALSVLNDSRTLATLAVAGGFAAPFLVSTGEGSHIVLFSYVAVINIVILAVAWFKSWRELNLIGFVFTVAVAALWGLQGYDQSLFWSTEFFLILFVLFYTVVTILHAYRSPARMRDPVDGILAFGVPVVAATVQTTMLSDYRVAFPGQMMAWSSIALAVFYLVVGVVLSLSRTANFGALGQVYAGIGTLFAVLAVPFAFNADATAAIWAAAGAGLVWLGIRHDRRYYRLLGALTQVFAGAAMLYFLIDVAWFDNPTFTTAASPIVDGFTFVGPVLAIAGIFSGYLFASNSFGSNRAHRFSEFALTIWGLLWWFGWGIRHGVWWSDMAGGPLAWMPITEGVLASGLLLFVSLSVAVFEWLGAKLNWTLIRFPALLLPLPTLLFLIVQMRDNGHVLGQGGWVALPVTFAVFYWTLYRRDGDTWQRFYHAVGLWALAFIGAVEAGYLVGQLGPSTELWTYVAWTLVPIVLVLGVSLRGRRIPWPTARHYDTYMTLGLGPILAALIVWCLSTTLSSDGSWQMRYIAVLNPLSIAQLVILGTTLVWLRRLPLEGDRRIAGYVGIAALGFLWLSAEMARTVHHGTGMPLEVDALLGSEVLQTGYSIVWTGLALVLMFSAKRRGLRWLWLIGAALLGVTVVKLFVVDLSNIGTLARIVSFLAVGALMLIIGYLAPIPPRQTELEDAESIADGPVMVHEQPES